MNLLILAQGSGQMGGSLLSTVIMFALIGLAFYFLILKPQKKQQKQMKETMENLKVGDHIITRAGVRGVVTQLKGDSFILESGPDNVKIEYLKQAISYVESADKQVDSANPFVNQPVGDLSYGNDTQFIEKLNELKDKDNKISYYDLLLEDVYEYVVKENSTKSEDVQKTFRLDEQRANKILGQLTTLGALSEKNIDGTRSVIIDPRK